MVDSWVIPRNVSSLAYFNLLVNNQIPVFPKTSYYKTCKKNNVSNQMKYLFLKGNLQAANIFSNS